MERVYREKETDCLHRMNRRNRRHFKTSTFRWPTHHPTRRSTRATRCRHGRRKCESWLNWNTKKKSRKPFRSWRTSLSKCVAFDRDVVPACCPFRTHLGGGYRVNSLLFAGFGCSWHHISERRRASSVHRTVWTSVAHRRSRSGRSHAPGPSFFPGRYRWHWILAGRIRTHLARGLWRGHGGWRAVCHCRSGREHLKDRQTRPGP